MAMEDVGKKSQAWEADWPHQMGEQRGRKDLKVAPVTPIIKMEQASSDGKSLSLSKNRER